MTNFQFLRPEFASLYEPAADAEQLAHSDPRAACMRIRFALERAVHWLYDYDRSLRRPYDRGLHALLSQPEFEALLPPPVLQKARLIQKQGNQAVHSNRVVRTRDALQLCRDLFHVLFWLARTYTRASDPKAIEATFDAQRIPYFVASDEAVAFTRDELKKQEQQFADRLAAERADLDAREAEIARRSRNLDEQEAALADVNAELVRVRAELAEAKARNIAVPDTHDYDELATRQQIIDVLLAEAGWTVGADASAEYPLTGMPSNTGDGYADYVLWGEDGQPLAVVEAKRALADPEIGRQQAKLYADCLEAMKGQRPVMFYTNGYQTWLWDDCRAAPRQVQGFFTREELATMVRRRTMADDPATHAVKRDIVERPYQQRAIAALCDAFTAGKRRGLLAMATGTGKTRTAIALVDLLMRANWVKRVLFLADRKELVRQASNAFKAHLPEVATVNLVREKHSDGRVHVSTYPTMMNLIDKGQGAEGGEARRFGVGFFDLVIVDEAHRSVYQKYGAIFDYFDSLLVGLTATPRDEVHRDTYHLFDLEPGVPTDAYTLDDAVADGYLVPPRAMSVPLKMVRQGVRYADLTPEEREHYEQLEWPVDEATGEVLIPDEVDAAQINKFLFNEDTVDKMLQRLMAQGIQVDGGDTVGKTIIFARNEAHAKYIAERFDANYPQYNGHFARKITHAEKYAESLIEDFKKPNAYPQIAISVDMLDTGIDVPEVVNLVFFKPVRSKVKFLQMIGRGTRLCPDLFGPGNDKAEFVIFDYCENFEFFNENPELRESAPAEPLHKRLFVQRLEVLTRLNVESDDTGVGDEAGAPHGDLGNDDELRRALKQTLQSEVAAMNTANFIVRPQREHVERFRNPAAWANLDDEAQGVLANHVAGLPSERPHEDISARLFDLTCLNLQVARLDGDAGQTQKLTERIQALASGLESAQNIPAVKAQLALIHDVQTSEFWEDITLPMIENVRRRLRGLIQFIEKKAFNPVYSALDDEIGEGEAVSLDDFQTGINLAQYRKKVAAFIRANEDHVAIAKLKHNRPLTASDLAELERFVFGADEVESRERFSEAFGEDQPLTVFIRSLVGLDRAAAQAAFADFINAENLGERQIRFVEMIIEQLRENGTIDPGLLYEPPFTGLHHSGLDGVFPTDAADRVVDIVRSVNANARSAQDAA
ncbi:DEAD/DEAH box helicase family protein [Salinisphaera sp. LB1]|uniref:DEAD/DEAH box helicase family protein n=1 Tax=Salinisphaera sp. LB1 TaxID=2183911 RepID=UPI000D705846|nr:DEAD/DEAH box helicase family protein [Salinisphaera sp. LB1]AWN14241.1 Type I restriction-modification system, restriction subunit R [Salinisphaera sp. LB1]